MRSYLLKSVAVSVFAMGISVVSSAAYALSVLPVQNLTFSTYSGANPKNNFSAVNPANWFRGPPAGSSDLVFIDAPGTATSGTGGYPVYGPFLNPPPGGNFVQADGNPDFESEFKQTITGLTAGQQYTLSFWQSAGQQTGFTGATTEQWKVFLGNDPVTLTGPVGGFYGVSKGTDSEADSTIMNTPSGGVSPWEFVTLTLTATAATNTLTFLAWGNGGSNVNQPPTVFLAGVNTPVALPEPATLSLLGAGLAGILLRRRTKRKAATI